MDDFSPRRRSSSASPDRRRGVSLRRSARPRSPSLSPIRAGLPATTTSADRLPPPNPYMYQRSEPAADCRAGYRPFDGALGDLATADPPSSRKNNNNKGSGSGGYTKNTGKWNTGTPDAARYGDSRGRSEDLQIGQIFQAAVTSLRPIGLFVELPGQAQRFKAMVHVGQISAKLNADYLAALKDKQVEDDMKLAILENFCSRGELVWVKISDIVRDSAGIKHVDCTMLEVDQDNGRDLEPSREAQIPPGGSGSYSLLQLPQLHSVHRALVQSVQPYGALLQLKGSDGSQGQVLLPCDHISEHLAFDDRETHKERIQAITQELPVGQLVWVKIIDVNPAAQRGQPAVIASSRVVNQRGGEDLDPDNVLISPVKRSGAGGEFGGGGGGGGGVSSPRSGEKKGGKPQGGGGSSYQASEGIRSPQAAAAMAAATTAIGRASGPRAVSPGAPSGARGASGNNGGGRGPFPLQLPPRGAEGGGPSAKPTFTGQVPGRPSILPAWMTKAAADPARNRSPSPSPAYDRNRDPTAPVRRHGSRSPLPRSPRQPPLFASLPLHCSPAALPPPSPAAVYQIGDKGPTTARAAAAIPENFAAPGAPPLDANALREISGALAVLQSYGLKPTCGNISSSKTSHKRKKEHKKKEKREKLHHKRRRTHSRSRERSRDPK